jgi:hypothetical protein
MAVFHFEISFHCLLHPVQCFGACVVHIAFVRRAGQMASSVQPITPDDITVPPELPPMLKAFAKEVIRFQPRDIKSFAKEYVS